MWDAPQTIRATGFAHVVGDLWSPRGVWRTQSRCVLWFSSALKVMLFFFVRLVMQKRFLIRIKVHEGDMKFHLSGSRLQVM